MNIYDNRLLATVKVDIDSTGILNIKNIQVASSRSRIRAK
ncbi:hypothetical protein GP5015_1651 [gamma proteobacterium HTCC5015]|nr:hypothetical protein GP5015_1651 [gamma proteobacterium HTCC5015]